MMRVTDENIFMRRANETTLDPKMLSTAALVSENSPAIFSQSATRRQNNPYAVASPCYVHNPYSLTDVVTPVYK